MENTKKRTIRKRKFSSFAFSAIYFITALIFIEAVFHITEFKNINFIFPAIFAVPIGFFLAFITDLFNEKAARVLRYVISVIIMLIFATQIVYFHVFHAFMSLTQVGMGDDVFTNFFKSILVAVGESLIPLLLTFLPLVALSLMHKFLKPKNTFNWKKSVALIVCFAVTQIFAVLILPIGGRDAHSAYDNFHSNWILDLSMEKLGVLTTTGKDLAYLIAGDSSIVPEEPDVPVIVPVPGQTTETESPDPGPDETQNGTAGSDSTSDGEPEPSESPYNIIEGLDFNALAEKEDDETLKLLMQYFAALPPTKKNEYTGMFEGYNLIMICGESFSQMGIDEKLTPTLWKLSHSGFVFDNYWTMFPSNTTNGEYAFLTGLIPDITKPKTDGSFLASTKNTMNMNVAAFFNGLGVTSRAYHNHSGNYYGRKITHPHLGFIFKGKEEIGGLSGWPESDLIMMQRTLPEYINDSQFFTYYMTVSGHHNYKHGGYNSIVDKNWDYVKDLDMSDSAKSYLACHIELDRALEHLISELDKAGKLEKTVICLCPDHYPYGLTDKEYRDMLGHKYRYDALERYCNTLIFWNSEMETVHIEKPCCPVDVLPTLLNLFGFEFDSRLYSGCDILSDSYGLAMISNQSFITDKYVYNSRYNTVYTLSGKRLNKKDLPEGYLDAYIQIVKNRFSVASNILNKDFYAKLPADIVNVAQHKNP